MISNRSISRTDWTLTVLLLQVTVNQEIMEITEYSPLPRSLDLEHCHQIQLSVIHRTPHLGVSFPSAEDLVNVF